MKKLAKNDLRKDLEKLTKNIKQLKSKQGLAKNKAFLHQMAEDIKKLNDDTLIAKNIPIAHLIHHILSTPFGAPFVSEVSLLEAALDFDYQEPIKSDLSHLIEDFSKYNTYFDDEFLKIFDSFLDNLK